MSLWANLTEPVVRMPDFTRTCELKRMGLLFKILEGDGKANAIGCRHVLMNVLGDGGDADDSTAFVAKIVLVAGFKNLDNSVGVSRYEHKDFLILTQFFDTKIKNKVL